MEEVIKLFEKIKNTGSTKEKQKIISENKENKLFCECLKFLLDTNIVTGISSKKLSKKILKIPTVQLNNFEDVMDYLSTHNSGTDEDIVNIQAFIDTTCEDYEFYCEMITKKYKLGVNKKSANVAIPNLIPTWEVQLGSAYDKLKLKNNEWFSLSQKLNGCRCSFYKGKLISRQGKEFIGMDHIISDLEQLVHRTFIDGELIRKNIDNIPDEENFRIGTGIVNSDAASKTEIKYVIFDYFPEDEIVNGKSDNTYRKRRESLNNLRKIIEQKDLKNIEVVEMVYEGTDESQIMKWLDYAEAHDWEGLMLNKDTPYECKRTTNLIKIKKFFSMDLPVVSVEEGSGRLKGTLGALVVQYKDNTINVGSGFDDSTRKELWGNRDSIVGRIIEVKYKEITKDKKTGLESLQFPVFVRVREVGKAISYD